MVSATKHPDRSLRLEMNHTGREFDGARNVVGVRKRSCLYEVVLGGVMREPSEPQPPVSLQTHQSCRQACGARREEIAHRVA